MISKSILFKTMRITIEDLEELNSDRHTIMQLFCDISDEVIKLKS